MKAFVIKNKEGKYLYVFYVYEDENYVFGELNTAMLFKDVYNANIYVDKVKMLNSRIDCEVVEVTIEEGDLEQQLAIYKRAVELACEKYINVDGISYVLRDNEDYFDKSDEQIQKETIDYFVSQAKKELEEKNA